MPETGPTSSSPQASADHEAEPPSRGRLLLIAAGLAAGLSAAVIWAAGSVVSRHLMTSSPLSAHDLALVRYAGALPLALLLLAIFPRRLASTVPAARLLVLLLLAGPLYQGLLIYGYGHATAGAGALLIGGLVPVFALILAASLGWGAQHSLSSGAIIGSGLVIAGLWLHAIGLPQTLDVAWTSVVTFATAALMWAVLNHVINAWSVDPLRLTVALVVWSPVFLPLWWMTRPPFDLATVPLEDLALQVVTHGWLTGLVATGLFFFAVRTLGAPVAAIQQATIPAFAAWFGDQALAEHATPLQLSGLALTTTGMVVAILSVAARRRRTA